MKEISRHSPLSDPHTLRATARVGNASLKLKVAMSSSGLLATAALVSGILLSTAVIVAVAVRGRAVS